MQPVRQDRWTTPATAFVESQKKMFDVTGKRQETGERAGDV